LRISFSNPNPIYFFCDGSTGDQLCNHYRVGEFEAYSDGPPADTTPPSITSSVIGTHGSNGWYTSNVSVTWTVVEQESPGSLVTTGCVDQAIIADQPDTSYSCSAASAGGTAGPVTEHVKRDATKPTVTYTGNAGTYTVADSVSIACTAADNLSGVASSTCANIMGPAWSFGLGAHPYTANAVDKAGNVGAGSASFTVTVDADSLCALVAQLSTKPGVAQSLCAKLSAASAAGARGQSKTKSNVVGAFNNEVDAQTGKALTTANASLLKSLAGSL
jgi:hypothetical protein